MFRHIEDELRHLSLLFTLYSLLFTLYSLLLAYLRQLPPLCVGNKTQQYAGQSDG
jgi:hypothetical protein